ncbi:MAG: glycoside hydrolase family 3 protein [Ekhidna sp.]
MKNSVILLLLLGFLSTQAQEQTPADSLDMMIGQMIMIGIGDFNKANTKHSIFDEIADGKAGGVVLYEKNLFFENPKPELAKLISNLQKNANIPLFVSIDEEGGRVNRFKTKYGFPKNVSAQYLGKINNLDSTSYYANQTAALLKSFGINMNYAPVLDVNINPSNPVIGKLERSFSRDYQEVTNHAQSVIVAHNSKEVVPVLKHFPGHGSSQSDTHLGVTDVTNSWQIEELYPYASLIDSGVVKAIMTAHIINSTLDNTKIPATLSKKVITGMLRGLLKFDGLIISDDMQMGAINNEYGLKESIRMSIDAGVDMLMFANNVKDYNMVTATQVHNIIKELIDEGAISTNQIAASYTRIMKLKEETGLLETDYFSTLKNKLDLYK